jgi:hypothetical protein
LTLVGWSGVDPTGHQGQRCGACGVIVLRHDRGRPSEQFVGDALRKEIEPPATDKVPPVTPWK